MQFGEDEIQQLTRMIWLSTLGLSVEPSMEVGARGTTIFTGCVHISGAWRGAVMLQCPGNLARKVAAIMFGAEEQELLPGQLEDALGEITNMTGGNIKALLPETSLLSLPAVVVGFDYVVRIPGAAPLSRLAFRCMEDHFVISVFQRASEGSPA